MKLESDGYRPYFNSGSVKSSKGKALAALDKREEEIDVLDSAIEDLSEAVRAEPENPDPLVNRAAAMSLKVKTLMQLGRKNDLTSLVDRMLRDYESALKVAPPDWPYAESIRKQVRKLKGGG